MSNILLKAPKYHNFENIYYGRIRKSDFGNWILVIYWACFFFDSWNCRSYCCHSLFFVWIIKGKTFICIFDKNKWISLVYILFVHTKNEFELFSPLLNRTHRKNFYIFFLFCLWILFFCIFFLCLYFMNCPVILFMEVLRHIQTTTMTVTTKAKTSSTAAINKVVLKLINKNKITAKKRTEDSKSFMIFFLFRKDKKKNLSSILGQIFLYFLFWIHIYSCVRAGFNKLHCFILILYFFLLYYSLWGSTWFSNRIAHNERKLTWKSDICFLFKGGFVCDRRTRNKRFWNGV